MENGNDNASNNDGNDKVSSPSASEDEVAPIAPIKRKKKTKDKRRHTKRKHDDTSDSDSEDNDDKSDGDSEEDSGDDNDDDDENWKKVSVPKHIRDVESRLYRPYKMIEPNKDIKVAEYEDNWKAMWGTVKDLGTTTNRLSNDLNKRIVKKANKKNFGRFKDILNDASDGDNIAAQLVSGKNNRRRLQEFCKVILISNKLSKKDRKDFKKFATLENDSFNAKKFEKFATANYATIAREINKLYD